MLCRPCALGGPADHARERSTCCARIVGGGLNGVLADPPDDRVRSEVERLAIRGARAPLERRLRSAALL